MPFLCRSHSWTLKTAALAIVAVVSATSLHAAPQDGMKAEQPKAPKSILDLQIPIPGEPDAVNNGCRMRQSPAEGETGALNEVSFWTLVERINLGHASKLTRDGPSGFATAIVSLEGDARSLAVLFMLWDNLGRDGLHTFFYLDKPGSAAPLVREALQKAGLNREFDVFSRAMALFGKDYPVDAEQRTKLFGWSKPAKRIDAVTTVPAPLNSFDHALLDVSRAFGTKAAFQNTIVAWINARPGLWQRIEAQRIHLNEPDRMRFLSYALSDRIGDLWQPFHDIEKRLASLSKEQRALAVMTAFNDEFKNGGVHQFFYNAEGALAPDVHEAMLELGLTEQAAIFKRGLDMFGKSYLRDTERRRQVNFGHKGWSDWDAKLSALTDDFYALNGGLSFHRIRDSMVVEGGPGIDFAMLKYARQHKLLPC